MFFFLIKHLSLFILEKINAVSLKLWQFTSKTIFWVDAVVIK